MISPERRLRMAVGLVRTLAEMLKRLASEPASSLRDLYVERAEAALVIVEGWDVDGDSLPSKETSASDLISRLERNAVDWGYAYGRPTPYSELLIEAAEALRRTQHA